MVIVQERYDSINKPELTDSFLLYLDDIKNIFDINKGEIGIKFARRFSILEYKIVLSGESVNMTARELLNLLIEVEGKVAFPPIIHGDVKIT